METVKSIRRKVPGSAYFKLSNIIVRERRLQYGHPICHSRHKRNFPFKSFRCGFALPSTLLFLLQSLRTLKIAVIVEQKNLKFCCYRKMKFENGVTRNFKITFVIQSSHYEPFLVFDTPAPPTEIPPKQIN